MNIIKVKVADLVLTEDNVRIHPKNQIEEYKRSLSMFGQTKNAVIDEDNNVLIGNGLVIAARELGWEEIAVIKRDDLSESVKLKLMVSDNKIFGLGIDNLDAIDEIFGRLAGDLNIPGYDEKTLQEMVADANTVTESLMQYGTLSNDEVNAIKNKTLATTVTPAAQADENEQEGVENSEPNPESDSSGNENDADDKISFKCPKCGEETWLSKDALRQLL